MTVVGCESLTSHGVVCRRSSSLKCSVIFIPDFYQFELDRVRCQKNANIEFAHGTVQQLLAGEFFVQSCNYASEMSYTVPDQRYHMTQY